MLEKKSSNSDPDKITPAEHLAIYLVNCHFCLRCGKVIDYQDLALKPFVLANFAKYPAKFRDYLNENKLWVRYKVNAYYNLEPYHRDCHKRNWNSFSLPPRIVSWLWQAKENEERVRELAHDLQNPVFREELIAILGDYLERVTMPYSHSAFIHLIIGILEELEIGAVTLWRVVRTLFRLRVHWMFSCGNLA